MDDKKHTDDENQPDLLTVAEASKFLRLKPSTIRAWMLHRRINFIKLGSRVFLQRADCLRLIERNVIKSVSEELDGVKSGREKGSGATPESSAPESRNLPGGSHNRFHFPETGGSGKPP